MSHPNPSHDRENEYPEDKVTHYPKRKSLGDKVTAKGKALERMIKEPASKEWFKKHGLPKSLRDGKGVEVAPKTIKTTSYDGSGKPPKITHRPYDKETGTPYSKEQWSKWQKK